MRLRSQRNFAGVSSAALLRLRARPAPILARYRTARALTSSPPRPRSSSWRLGVLASCPTPNQGNGLAQRLEAPAQGAPNPTPMQPHCRAVRQDAKTPRHQDSARPPKAPQAPQRTRQRNSTNSSSPTYPHHPKRPHAANTQHLGKEQKGTSPLKASPQEAAYAPAASQQKGAVSRREPRATGPGEFFTRSRTIGTTSINRANANAASKSQKRLFTYTTSCGGYRVKKLGGSPSSRPRRRPAVALPLRPKAPQAPQRKRQRNSTNSTSPTHPHHPKCPHAANTQLTHSI